MLPWLCLHIRACGHTHTCTIGSELEADRVLVGSEFFTVHFPSHGSSVTSRTLTSLTSYSFTHQPHSVRSSPSAETPKTPPPAVLGILRRRSRSPPSTASPITSSSPSQPEPSQDRPHNLPLRAYQGLIRRRLAIAPLNPSRYTTAHHVSGEPLLRGQPPSAGAPPRKHCAARLFGESLPLRQVHCYSGDCRRDRHGRVLVKNEVQSRVRTMWRGYALRTGVEETGERSTE
ncbi:uncharacterized protein CC84DRAFT_1169408 [Paraphaeosphaeria sporulosa]|uniref:Uncharacterized protein n=1 Tax=Paraphaeosphaeria sporulosa TaxID=1460663 RepID=A0A177BWD8_9PLEO|nr:uncharacterized protein CC84DRAFT_1169408 [Paraphaeosphaeria sporulosa]OAF99270.1 hypothetical protein CC84DRAFT_1169408 [Paraphaeosphaeria sporulosa]